MDKFEKAHAAFVDYHTTHNDQRLCKDEDGIKFIKRPFFDRKTEATLDEMIESKQAECFEKPPNSWIVYTIEGREYTWPIVDPITEEEWYGDDV